MQPVHIVGRDVAESLLFRACFISFLAAVGFPVEEIWFTFGQIQVTTCGRTVFAGETRAASSFLQEHKRDMPLVTSSLVTSVWHPGHTDTEGKSSPPADEPSPLHGVGLNSACEFLSRHCVWSSRHSYLLEVKEHLFTSACMPCPVSWSSLNGCPKKRAPGCVHSALHQEFLLALSGSLTGWRLQQPPHSVPVVTHDCSKFLFKKTF